MTLASPTYFSHRLCEVFIWDFVLYHFNLAVILQRIVAEIVWRRNYRYFSMPLLCSTHAKSPRLLARGFWVWKSSIKHFSSRFGNRKCLRDYLKLLTEYINSFPYYGVQVSLPKIVSDDAWLSRPPVISWSPVTHSEAVPCRSPCQ